MSNLITTLPRAGDAGTIVDSRGTNIVTVKYTTNLIAQQYTLNLNPIAGAITNLATYSMTIRGSQSTLVFRQGQGTSLLDLTSQLTAHINRFGYLWASITGSGTINLTSREPGIDNQFMLQGGLFGATLTQTISPSNPSPLVAGTAVFWDRTYNPSNPWASNLVIGTDVASTQPGFSAQRDLAGIILRSKLNYSNSDLITGTELEIMRTGNIWVRNYGTSIINRSSVPTINTSASTPILPSGAFGDSLGLPMNFPLNLQYQSIARPNETAILGINLA